MYSPLAYSQRAFTTRFDISKVLIAYIQSRGRARKKNSKYMIMINSENKKEVKLIDEFRRGEAKMKEFCRLLPEDRNLATKFPVNSSEDIKQSIIDKYLSGAYTIPSTGALITLSNAIALIYHYCDCLPSDNFCNFKPIYEIKSITPEELLQDYNELIETDSYPAGNEYFYCKLTLPINACLKIVESIGRSKSDVKARVSLKACIALYRSGDIDENLIPKSKKQKKALMDNIEFDEEGKQVGSRGREQLYDKKMPSFWINEQKNMVDASFKFERGPYWISVFDIDMPPLESGNLRFRPMILITKKPLPDIPEIILFNDNSPFKVHVRSSSRPFLFEKDHHPQVLADYALAMMRIITNKEFQCQHMSDMAYFLAPLMRDTDTTTPSPLLQNKIDWSEVLNTICNNTKTYMTTEDVDDLEPNSQDTIVIDSSDQNKRRYIIQRIQYNMSPLSRVIMPSDASKPIREQDYETFAAYYQDRPYFKKEITDMNQPLLRVIQQRKNSSFLSAAPTTSKKEKEPESAVYWLIPELCQMYPVTASVYETLQVIPAIMTRIDAVLLLMDAKTTLNLKNIDMDFMLEAYTTSSAYMNKDYQRLEFFGGKCM
jgi:endoribonuclease Dicer